MKEPVHDHEQHGDREQAGRGLEVEAPGADGVGHRDRDKPGRDRCAEGGRASERERLAVCAVGAAHARRQNRQHEDRLQALAEHQDAAVEHDREVAQVRVRVSRVRSTPGGGRELPDEQSREHDPERPPPELFASHVHR